MTGIKDWWDISMLSTTHPERIGYPTQKPEALLERIIKASSNKGDFIMDAFCGGGTTIAVADRLERKWIGIDQSVQAIKVTDARLQNAGAKNVDANFSKYLDGFLGSVYSVKLHKYDYDILRYSDAFEFESWIVEQFGGEANAKQRGDMGLDGKKNNTPIQVKRSDAIGRNVVDNFKSAIARFYGKDYNSRLYDKITDGYIIAFSFSKGAYEEIARLKNEEGLIIELIKVEDIVAIAQKPKIEINFEDKGLNEKGLRIINFKARTETKVEFFQWDFNYDIEKGFKAEVMIDKEGVYEKEFLSGQYKIACKAIDLEGLEAIEVIELKINGSIKKV